MKNVVAIIKKVSRQNPLFARHELHEAVMNKIKKEWFLSLVELAIKEEEVEERLRNY